MAKIPHAPEEIFEEFTLDLKNCFGDHLQSILLYGSGARGEYVRKRSDINFLVILSEDGIHQLARAFDLVKKWQKRNVSVPLFLTLNYIQSSLDSFPLEFLALQRSHRLVFGQDVLEHLVIARDHLRLQCEEQIKGKLLHLREGFLQTLGRKRPVENLLRSTIPAFVSLFSGLLVLRNIEPPAQTDQLFQLTARSFDLDEQVFDQVVALGERRLKLKRQELVDLAERYIRQIRAFAMIVDKL